MLDLLRDVKPSWTEATQVMAADVLDQLQDYVHKHGAQGRSESVHDIEHSTLRPEKVMSVVENPSEWLLF